MPCRRRRRQVVALALNSVLQPAGRICGGTDSPALRLSPPFQIANALILIYQSVRLSFALGLQFRKALGVVAEWAELHSDRSGITEPERHPFFRTLVFIFGALPTLIKALAIQGDRVSYGLVLGFFVPFVVLESIDWLKKEPSWAELAGANSMRTEKNLSVTVLVGLFALGIHINLCLQTMNFALMKSTFEANAFKTNRIIEKYSPQVATTGSLVLKLYEWAPEDGRALIVWVSLSSGSSMLLLTTSLEIINMWGRWSEIMTTVLAIAVAITGTLAHLLVYLYFTSTTLRQLVNCENWHKQKFMEQWIALWTVTCIFLYYGYLYDASGTYKPAWTEWLP